MGCYIPPSDLDLVTLRFMQREWALCPKVFQSLLLSVLNIEHCRIQCHCRCIHLLNICIFVLIVEGPQLMHYSHTVGHTSSCMQCNNLGIMDKWVGNRFLWVLLPCDLKHLPKLIALEIPASIHEAMQTGSFLCQGRKDGCIHNI